MWNNIFHFYTEQDTIRLLFYTQEGRILLTSILCGINKTIYKTEMPSYC